VGTCGGSCALCFFFLVGSRDRWWKGRGEVVLVLGFVGTRGGRRGVLWGLPETFFLFLV